MKGILDRFDGKFRLATKEERDELRFTRSTRSSCPTFPRSPGPTAEDVRPAEPYSN